MILDCFYKILCRLISNIQSVNSNYYVLELNKTVVLFILYLSIVYLLSSPKIKFTESEAFTNFKPGSYFPR